jgi:hypothetical protein
MLHSVVHCRFNIENLRFWLYCVSALTSWRMLIRALLNLA